MAELSIEVPLDDAGEQQQAAVEQQAVEQGKAALADDQGLASHDEPQTPPEVAGILQKYGNDPVKLAQAYRSLQQMQSKGQAPEGEAPKPVDSGPAPTLTQEQVDGLRTALTGAAGNEAKLQALGAWARTNVEPARVEAYNKAVISGDVNAALTHLKAMQYDYVVAQGVEGPLVGGRQPATQSVQGFRSQGEMEAAIADPRYSPQSTQFDEAYHRSVIEKIAAM